MPASETDTTPGLSGIAVEDRRPIRITREERAWIAAHPERAAPCRREADRAIGAITGQAEFHPPKEPAA